MRARCGGGTARYSLRSFVIDVQTGESMGYVMVPVPEEHVEEAMQAVLRISARAAVTDWDMDSLTELFGGLDEAAKAVISGVARATLARGSIIDHDLAKIVEITQREVMGVVREVNELAGKASHPALVGAQTIVEPLPNGRTQEQRHLSMQRPLAELVKAVEKEELAALPHPLMGDQG